MSKPDLGGYVEVWERLVEFRAKYPDGSLQPADPSQPYRIETVGDRSFITYVAAAYRTPDDPRPGIGSAMEPFPGATPYTRGSELQNAETSAWGRALIAVGAADAKRGIASADEVRARQAETLPADRREASREVYDATDPAKIKRRMFALFMRAGISNNREDRIQFCRVATGRESINSSDDLTAAEVAMVIKALEAGATEDKRETPRDGVTVRDLMP